jgi:hypothetical protein
MQKLKRVLAAFLIVCIIFIQIEQTKKNAYAFAAAVIPIVDVAPEIITALMTLIAAGMTVHSDDMALAAAEAYADAEQPLGTLASGVVTVTSTVAAAANAWLQTYIASVTAGTGTYTQTVGSTVGPTPAESIDWTASSSGTLFNAVPLNDGITVVNVENWQAIRDWILAQTDVTPDTNRCASFIASAISSYQTINVRFFHDWIEIMDANYISYYIFYSTELANISQIRFWYDHYYDQYEQADWVNFNIQVFDDILGEWEFPSDAPFIGGLNPEGICLQVNTDTALPISTTWDIPITLNPTDITSDTATPTDRTFSIPTDWTGVLDKTYEDISDPTDTPEDPPVTEPTSILDWLAQLWTWIQAFWAWIQTIPQLIADAIAGEFVIGPNDAIDYSKLHLAAEIFTDKFPFSLPWDLKNMVLTFGAGSTEAPVIPIAINGLEADIDLSKFNTIAAGIRVLELFAFGVGLLFGTRKLLGGAS